MPASSFMDSGDAAGAPVAAVWRAGRGPLAVLPTTLFEDRRPVLAVLVGWLLAFAGSALLGFVMTRIAPGGAGVELGDASAPMLLFAVGVFAPVVETLIMGAVLVLLLRWVPPWVAVVVSALGWGVAHSTQALLWGAVIWWPFVIFSTLFVTWRARGFWRAAALVAVAHMLQNAGPAVAMVLGY